MNQNSIDDPILVKGEDIYKTYRIRFPIPRKVEVLKGTNIEIRKGEITGIVGENGSGKSTLMNILVGELNKDKGELKRRGTIGWCPQDLRLYPRLTVNETFKLFGKAYELSDDEILKTKENLAKGLGFQDYLDSRIDRLSGGNKQKVNLSIALMHEPDVLMLDEPYTGFDWKTYQAFWDMSERLVENGTAIALISHIIEREEKIDTLYELKEGKTVKKYSGGE